MQLYIYRIRQNKKGCKGNFPYSLIYNRIHISERARFLFYRKLRQCKPFKENAEHSLNRRCRAAIFYHAKSSGVTPLKLAAGMIEPDFTSA